MTTLTGIGPLPGLMTAITRLPLVVGGARRFTSVSMSGARSRRTRICQVIADDASPASKWCCGPARRPTFSHQTGRLRSLPIDVRFGFVATVPRPWGAWWVRKRAEESVPVRVGHRLLGAAGGGDRAALTDMTL